MFSAVYGLNLSLDAFAPRAARRVLNTAYAIIAAPRAVRYAPVGERGAGHVEARGVPAGHYRPGERPGGKSGPRDLSAEEKAERLLDAVGPTVAGAIAANNIRAGEKFNGPEGPLL